MDRIVPVRVLVTGDAGVGKTSLMRRFLTGAVSEVAIKSKRVSMNVDGIAVLTLVSEQPADTPPSVIPVKMLLFDVWKTNIDALRRGVEESDDMHVVLIGTKVDAGHRGTWTKNVADVRREFPNLLVFLTSAKRDYGVTAAFESAVRAALLVHSTPLVTALQHSVSMVPRSVTPLYAEELSLHGAMQVGSATFTGIPIVVLLTQDDLDELGDAEATERVSPRISSDAILWLEGKTKRSYGAQTVLNADARKDRMFFGRSGAKSADEWLASPTIAIGTVGENGYGSDDVIQYLSTARSLDDHQRRPIIPWSARREFEAVLMHAARSSALSVRLLLAAGAAPWAACHATLVRWRRALAMVDFTELAPIKGTTDTYEIAGKLGEGAFGCVLRTEDDRALKITFFEDSADASRKRGIVDENYARVEIAIPQYIAAACAHATPYLPDGITGYIADTVSGADKEKGTPSAPGASRSLAEEIAFHCPSKFKGGDVSMLKRGGAVTLGPLFDKGDLIATKSEAYTAEAIPAIAFQLAHQLLTYHAVVGFRHVDIKGDNVLVRSRRSHEPGTFNVCVRMPVPGEPLRSTTKIFSDASDLVAVYADFGLSAMTAAPRFTLDAVYGSTEVELHMRFGTKNFMDPTAGMFYDPNDPDATQDKLSIGARSRGFAADIWATGLTLLSAWNRLYITDDADVSVIRFDSGIDVLVNEPSGIHSLAKQLRDSVALKRDRKDPDREEDRNLRWGEFVDAKVDKAYYARTFVNALLLHKAFHGTWPDRKLGSGPYWDYVYTGQATVARRKAAFLDALEDAASIWRTSEPGSVYDYIVRKMNDVEVKDFFAKCFTFDPEERAEFFRSGAVFLHPFVQRGVSTGTVDLSNCAHALDLYDLDKL